MTDQNLRRLGHSGLLVSAIGLGGNNFGRTGTASYTLEGTAEVVHTALDAGITLIDTADVYGERAGLSEELLGEVLKGRRDEVVLASKFGHDTLSAGLENRGAQGSRRYIRFAVEASLRRLQTDWIDLYQMHSPDPLTPIEETLAALNELVVEGKVRYIGHSNFSAWQAVEAEWVARSTGMARFISGQNEYNLLTRGAEAELFPALERYGVGFLPWFPLYNGLFSGKFTAQGGPAQSRIMRQRPHLLESAPWAAMAEYEALCRELGESMVNVTFAWLLAQSPLSSVIAGATTVEQVRLNAAAGSVRLDPATITRISELFPRSA